MNWVLGLPLYPALGPLKQWVFSSISEPLNLGTIFHNHSNVYYINIYCFYNFFGLPWLMKLVSRSRHSHFTNFSSSILPVFIQIQTTIPATPLHCSNYKLRFATHLGCCNYKLPPGIPPSPWYEAAKGPYLYSLFGTTADRPDPLRITDTPGSLQNGRCLGTLHG